MEKKTPPLSGAPSSFEASVESLDQCYEEMAKVSESHRSYLDDNGYNATWEYSNSDNNSDCDLYSETESDDDYLQIRKNVCNIQWTGYDKRIPVILFRTEAVHNKRTHSKTVGEQYHMSFKFIMSDCKIIRTILLSHGFLEAKPDSSKCNLIWSNLHLKPSSLRSMTHFQKINHFPRSYELTRKDRLFKNIQRMQQTKGHKNFDFIPTSYVLPGDYEEFCSSYVKKKDLYIVKPVASSQGRGVFLISNPEQVPLDENVIVSRYIWSPLVIEGFKFDIRAYVAVTSYDPVVIYLYEEGLTRFATVKYKQDIRHLQNQCMHLTNFSVNKRSSDYVKNENPDVEDYGNKWSMSAMLRYLKSAGRDTASLMMQIESVIIKTILSAESTIAAACKLYQPYQGTCFELYGFDILIDQTLKPWVLEVNFSPSLACDSPLDLKIKSSMLCDLFSLAGVVCQDPSIKTRLNANRHTQEITARMASKCAPCSHSTVEKHQESVLMAGLKGEEIKVLRRVKEEERRKGGWIRIFPNPDSWEKYGAFLQFPSSRNLMLHQRLYPDRHTETTGSKISGTSFAVPSRSKNKILPSVDGGGNDSKEKDLQSYALAVIRTRQYERSLGKIGIQEQRLSTIKPMTERLVQGLHEAEDNGDNKCGEDCVNNEKGEDRKWQKAEPEIIDVSSDKTDTKQSAAIKTPISAEKVPDNPEMKVTTTDNVHEKKELADLRKPKQFYCSTLTCSDVIGLLQSGYTFSEVQARKVFSTYLEQVWKRLVFNWSTFIQQRGVAAASEQIALLLRFLKCVTAHLPESLHFVLPSKRLSLRDKKRILVRQLGIFINFHCMETERIKYFSEIKKGELQNSEHCNCLDELHFARFIFMANEDELEAALITYTRKNESEEMFLGLNSKLRTDTCLFKNKRELLHCSHNNRIFSYELRRLVAKGDMTGVRQGSVDSSVSLDVKTNSSGLLTTFGQHMENSVTHHRLSKCHLTLPNSYSGAVAVYTQKLRRPRSATNSSSVHKVKKQQN